MRGWIGNVVCAVGLALVGVVGVCGGQTSKVIGPVPLDPARDAAVLEPNTHAPLPEEYVWTAGDVTVKRSDHNKFPWNRPELRVEPHGFRTHFAVKTVPGHATLYVAGPREAHVFLNGKHVEDFYSDVDAPIGFHVFHVDVTGALRKGDNVLAIEAVRGRGVVSALGSAATQQMAYGEVLAAKIVPRVFGVEAPALVISDKSWRSSAAVGPGWSDARFDDAAWQPVESLGPVEGNSEFFQWSVDAGMYGWPGYRGMSAGLRTLPLRAVAATHVFRGRETMTNLDALTRAEAGKTFSVTHRAGAQETDADAPSLLLDFGREISGRVLIESDSDEDSVVSIAYGESELEAMATGLTPEQQGGNYLGTNVLEVPAHGVARGPKSGFRYVRVRFLRGAKVESFKAIRAEAIVYPIQYLGTFESSDAEVNRIWETGAYTAHLCMQDGIWDAPKRDRGQWIGDLAVEGKVISDAFGGRELQEETLAKATAGSGPVDGIPNYSALWVTALFNLYGRAGDREFVVREHDALVHVLGWIDDSLAADGLFDNAKHRWLFVDWSLGLWGYTHDAVVGTNLQDAMAYRQAGVLFAAAGDAASAEKYRRKSEEMLAKIRARFADADGLTYGRTWQINALAAEAFGGKAEGDAVWGQVLSKVKQDAPGDQVISPYFNATVLDAMAAAGHRREALAWMKAYWGGMLAEGATSFWESYDLRWPKTNPHLSLQADGTSGFFVSMAHGWSTGPTAWLLENVLGVRDAKDGYKTVTISPDLAGLAWAKGTVPTPHGLIRVEVDGVSGVVVDLPAGIEQADVQLPWVGDGEQLYLNGERVVERARAAMHHVELTRAGHYVLAVR
jgi:alpha-L-rhamnosidase